MLLSPSIGQFFFTCPKDDCKHYFLVLSAGVEPAFTDSKAGVLPLDDKRLTPVVGDPLLSCIGLTLLCWFTRLDSNQNRMRSERSILPLEHG